MTRIGDERIDVALKLLSDRSLVTLVRGEYKPTDEGIALAQSIAKNPKIKTSIKQWKIEVLTGMDTKGKKSKIKRAAIPSPPQIIYTDSENPEEAYGAYEERKRIATQLCKRWRLTPTQYDQAVVDGRIRICKGIDGVSHIGIFDHRGKGWQTYCRECKKKQRKRYKGSKK
jgi:hypothetical protein